MGAVAHEASRVRLADDLAVAFALGDRGGGVAHDAADKLMALDFAVVLAVVDGFLRPADDTADVLIADGDIAVVLAVFDDALIAEAGEGMPRNATRIVWRGHRAVVLAVRDGPTGLSGNAAGAHCCCADGSVGFAVFDQLGIAKPNDPADLIAARDRAALAGAVLNCGLIANTCNAADAFVTSDGAAETAVIKTALCITNNPADIYSTADFALCSAVSDQSAGTTFPQYAANRVFRAGYGSAEMAILNAGA